MKLESMTQLIDYFVQGEKPPAEWRVGTEHEKFGIYEKDFSPVPYAGERGIQAVLERIAQEDNWQPILEGKTLIGLTKGAASITLEPGGQLELSGAPLRTLHENCREIASHLELVKRISKPLGIIWIGLGINPLHSVAEVPQMPKQRYRIMTEYLPTRGQLALEMMYTTATIQANFDYMSERDMADKMRTAFGVTSIVSAIYANSTIAQKKATGFASRRMHIWTDTDSDRSGFLPFVFEDGFGYERYIEWALDVPMFFLVRDGQYLPICGKTTFRKFMQQGYEGQHATFKDFEVHLTTLFPEVRLKRYIEVRGSDAQPASLTCSVPAIWKGILYDKDSCQAAYDLTRHWTFEERLEAHRAAARCGLAGKMGKYALADLARELVEISAEGLRRLSHKNAAGDDERVFLDVPREFVAQGKSPGVLLLELWQHKWAHSPERLVEYAQY